MNKRVLQHTLLFINLCFLNCENKTPKVTTIEKSSHTYKTLASDNLVFDYYKPQGISEELPLIIYVHGGGFTNGKRDNKSIVDLAHKLANNGYATISLSYRLTRENIGFNCNTRAKDKIKAFNDASEDISYAINYILKNKSIFKIKQDKIIIGGASAGAEAILNLIYTTHNRLLPKDFKFAGLICRSGALTSLENITGNTAIPIQLFHGNKDKSVPYNTGSHHSCKKKENGYLKLYGSRAIANRLKQLNKTYYLVTLKNGNHGMRGFSQNDYTHEILSFLKTLDTETKTRQIERSY